MATSGAAAAAWTVAARTIALISKAREIRLALLEEGAHGFFRLGRGEPLDEDAAFVRDLLLHRLGVRGFHQALGEADRFRRQRGELACRLLRRREELLFVHDGGDDADLARFLGGEGLAEEQELGRALVASDERQKKSRAELRH